MQSGKSRNARRGRRIGLLVGAVAVALGIGGVGAGGAVAAPLCTGSNIIGEGASLQKVSQQTTWIPGFQGPGGECFEKGTEPKVTYEALGSGAGLTAWDFNGPDAKPFDTSRGFTATDDAPTTTQIGNAETAAGGAKVLVIPVTQTSIAVAVNPPAECDVEELTNKQFESIFRGNIKNWGKIDTAFGTGCAGAPITRVVRKDGSGTTFQFKNYLFQVNSASLACTSPASTWKDLMPIGTGSKPNITWPENGVGGCGATTLSPVVTGAANGNGPLIEKVNATDGSIGYAAISDIESKKVAGTHSVRLQNNGLVKLANATFAEPAIEANKSANCASAQYTVPAAARVGTGTGLSVDWSAVFGAAPKIGGEDYPLCTLTYDMALNDYSAKAGFTEAQVTTVRDYLTEYVVAATGQSDIANGESWYAPLPTSATPAFNVLGAAQLAAGKIAF